MSTCPECGGTYSGYEVCSDCRTDERISLNKVDFLRLVSGRNVEKEGVTIVLDDLGFTVMNVLITQAQINKAIQP